MALMSDAQIREIASELLSEYTRLRELVGCDQHEDLVNMLADIDAGYDANAGAMNNWIRGEINTKISNALNGTQAKRFKAIAFARVMERRYKVDV